RQYTLHRGRRETLISLFEREFVESQEALGMHVLGTFRDLDAMDRFVWLRGFRDMDLRPRALAAFYDGPVWRAHRDEANATMVDSDDVLLLRPLHPSLAFGAGPPARAPIGDAGNAPGVVTVTIGLLDAPAHACGLDALVRLQVAPLLAHLGARVAAGLVTEPRTNNYPRLPVREGVNALVWVCVFDDDAALRAHVEARKASPSWRDEILPALQRHLRAPLKTLRLAPTARSALHARAASPALSTVPTKEIA
ncbi:MAG TPA: NIPSNAP family protein, partial [Albitalea sp.]|nr:NIPSNAP family protein [Albitalea sp.]